VNRPTRPIRRPGQHGGEALESVQAEDPASGVVRGVDEDGAGARRDGRLERVQVELEGRWSHGDPDGLAAGRDDQQLVEEPWRREEDDVVAGLQDRAERHGDRGEPTVRHRDVLGIPLETRPRGQ
jgi:hypothetical protein